MAKFKLPKFHDRASLLVGILAGLALAIEATFGVVAFRQPPLFYVGRVFQLCMGVALSIHCWDMLRYYRKHRIVRIVKTDKLRIVYKR